MSERIDTIFPRTYKEQVDQYKGNFSSRAIALSLKWCRRAIKSNRGTIKEVLANFFPSGTRKKKKPIVHYDDGSKFSVIIKMVSYKSDEEKDIAIREILAGNLRHQAILPLLGMAEDPKRECYYLVFPYMATRDVRHCLDDEKINKHIKKNDWIRILYQISCALVFLHTEVEEFRGKISHGDVTSTNILLDQDLNARLGDFGQSREYLKGKDGITNHSITPEGTLGYYDEERTDFINIKTDIIYFGIVLLEVLTGCKPAIIRNGGIIKKPLLTKSEDELGNEYQMKNQFWGHDTFSDLLSLAIRCRGSQLNAKELCNELKDSMVYRGVAYIESSTDICHLCLVTVKVEDVIRHTTCKLNICVNCLRNSSINPITCFCQEKITCPIGHKTGAIFMIGHWSDEQLQRRSANDIRDIRAAIITKHPLSIGIREENTRLVNNVYEVGVSKRELSEKGVSKLVIFYSGEADRNNMLLLQEQKANATVLSANLYELGYSCIVCIFDCCYGPDIGSVDKVLVSQLKACLPSEQVNEQYDQRENSRFTTQLLHALQGSSSNRESYSFSFKNCLHIREDPPEDGLVSLEHLRDKIQMGDVEVATQIHGNNTTRSSRFAYRNKHAVCIKFCLVFTDGRTADPIEYSKLPLQMDILLKELLKRYKAHDNSLEIPLGYCDVLQLTTDFSERKALELTSLLQVENAHGRQMPIKVKLRQLKDIRNGRIAVFPKCSTMKVYEFCLQNPHIFFSYRGASKEYKSRFGLSQQWLKQPWLSQNVDLKVILHFLDIIRTIDFRDLSKQGYNHLVMTFLFDHDSEDREDSEILKSFYFIELE